MRGVSAPPKPHEHCCYYYQPVDYNHVQGCAQGGVWADNDYVSGVDVDATTGNVHVISVLFSLPAIISPFFFADEFVDVESLDCASSSGAPLVREDATESVQYAAEDVEYADESMQNGNVYEFSHSSAVNFNPVMFKARRRRGPSTGPF